MRKYFGFIIQSYVYREAKHVVIHIDDVKVADELGELPELEALKNPDMISSWLTITNHEYVYIDIFICSMYKRGGANYFDKFVKRIQEVYFPPLEMTNVGGFVGHLGMYILNENRLANDKAANEIGFPWYEYPKGKDPLNLDTNFKTTYNIRLYCSAVVFALYYTLKTRGNIEYVLRWPNNISKDYSATADAVLQMIYPFDTIVAYLAKMLVDMGQLKRVEVQKKKDIPIPKRSLVTVALQEGDVESDLSDEVYEDNVCYNSKQ